MGPKQAKQCHKTEWQSSGVECHAVYLIQNGSPCHRNGHTGERLLRDSVTTYKEEPWIHFFSLNKAVVKIINEVLIRKHQ